MRKHVNVILIFSIFVLCNGCSDDGSDAVEIIKEDQETEENFPPTIIGQSFEVEENATLGTLIGTIEAQDAENKPLVFSMNPIDGLLLDSTDGTLTTEKGAEFLDYETNEEFKFEVSVSDGNATAKSVITLIIINIEDGPLTNFEKAIIEGFKVEILGNSTDFPLFKWSTTAKIYYSGEVTPALKSITSASLNAYNELFTDGFKIEIVNDSLSANVQLYSSSITALKEKWPDFGAIADENPGLGGIASIGGGKIWIADYAQNVITMKHEMGHMIGLYHAPAQQCDGKPEQNSIMCGGVGAAGVDLTDLDRRIIQYYYSPEISNNQDAQEVLDKLTELILSDRTTN